MKRGWIGVLALAALASAEEAPKEKPDGKPAIDVQIEADLPGAYRSSGITRVLDRDPDQDSEFFLSPRATVRAVARLPKTVDVVVEIENARLRAGLFDTSTWGTEANRTIPDGGNDFEALLEQAYVRVGALGWRELSLKIGLQDFALSLRRPGDAFFADLQESEFALVSPVAETVVSGSLYGAAPPAGTSPASAGVFRDRADAGGARLTWDAGARALLFVDAFYFTTLEGGVDHADERFYGLNADLLVPIVLERPSLVNLLAAGIENDKTGSRIWTAGLGLDVVLPAPDGLSLFLEAYWQSGRYAEPAGRRIRQSAWAGRLGARLPLGAIPLKPVLEASFWLLTGDRGDPADHVNRDFVSYENIDDALVVEDDLYGLDIDSNYFSPRLRLTGTAKLFNEDDFKIQLLYAYFRFYREIEKAGGAAELDPGRRLGHEVDLRLSLDLNEYASIAVFAGALLDSQWLASDDAFGTGRRHAFVGGVAVSVSF
jgi:hypothetical protein